MKDEASYVCDSCGEEIVLPVDLTAGTDQEYVEGCRPQAMLDLRTTYVNGQWHAFQTGRIKQERKRLYP